MKEELIPQVYCVHCLINGEVTPATVFMYNFTDALSLPLCDECYEYELSKPVKLMFDLN